MATAADHSAKGEDFQRTQHLWFAGLGLLACAIGPRVGALLPILIDTDPWSSELELLVRLIPLCLAAPAAWLAFYRFDTGSGVTLLPKRWTDIGIVVAVAVAYGVRELTIVLLMMNAPDEVIARQAEVWLHALIDPLGGLRVGWLLACMVAIAVTEEIAFRGLLLRSLEGFMGPWSALVAHAIVFELVHVFVYDLNFQGGLWFIVALIHGYAFQRTRSIAVPALMHSVSLVIHHTTLWALL